MRDRITKEKLELLTVTLNRITGNPEERWFEVDGIYTPNHGCYYIGCANGGYALEQMDGSGSRKPLYVGRCTARELYDAMQCFIEGIQLGKKL